MAIHGRNGRSQENRSDHDEQQGKGVAEGEGSAPKFGKQKQNADGGDDGRAHETANGATAASASKLSTHLCNLLARFLAAAQFVPEHVQSRADQNQRP